MEHCISVDQFTPESLYELCHLANRKIKPRVLDGLVITNLFYEPSTRTSSSFYSAATRLGGSVIQINNVQYSSVAKGETLEDTIMTMAQYSECIVLRHPEIGSAQRAAKISPVPIINAGDGSGEHPTQALLDLYTIANHFNLIEKLKDSKGSEWQNLKVGLMGDLKYGRTVHSLRKLLSLYGIDVYLISPESLMMPDQYLNGWEKYSPNLNEFIQELDVLYLTRVQKERMSEGESFGTYGITLDQVNMMKDRSIIMHPLPRNEELPIEIDTNPKAKYFEQMKNGLHIRMALFEYMFG